MSAARQLLTSWSRSSWGRLRMTTSSSLSSRMKMQRMKKSSHPAGVSVLAWLPLCSKLAHRSNLAAYRQPYGRNFRLSKHCPHEVPHQLSLQTLAPAQATEPLACTLSQKLLITQLSLRVKRSLLPLNMRRPAMLEGGAALL